METKTNKLRQNGEYELVDGPRGKKVVNSMGATGEDECMGEGGEIKRPGDNKGV